MNTYNINDVNFINSPIYEEFIKNNQGRGNLKIRAYAASQAIPIPNLKIVVSTTMNGDNVIFFNGSTNESGVVEKITLPAPKLDENNLDAPLKTTYEILATYEDDTSSVFTVDMYDGICVVQNINFVPVSSNGIGDY